MGAKDWILVSLARTNPVSSEVYAGCSSGVTVIATDEAALDQPTQLDPRFLAECNGRNLYLHAMHSVVDWFAFAVWQPDGSLVRALSVSPEGTELRDHRILGVDEHALQPSSVLIRTSGSAFAPISGAEPTVDARRY